MCSACTWEYTRPSHRWLPLAHVLEWVGRTGRLGSCASTAPHSRQAMTPCRLRIHSCCSTSFSACSTYSVSGLTTLKA